MDLTEFEQEIKKILNKPKFNSDKEFDHMPIRYKIKLHIDQGDSDWSIKSCYNVTDELIEEVRSSIAKEQEILRRMQKEKREEIRLAKLKQTQIKKAKELLLNLVDDELNEMQQFSDQLNERIKLKLGNEPEIFSKDFASV